jgi:hypothetical protein
MEALNRKPKCELRANIVGLCVLTNAEPEMLFRSWRTTAARIFRDTNAAWVAGPSRICFLRMRALILGLAWGHHNRQRVRHHRHASGQAAQKFAVGFHVDAVLAIADISGDIR